MFSLFFFFNDTATTEIYTLSLHDALPISAAGEQRHGVAVVPRHLHGEHQLAERLHHRAAPQRPVPHQRRQDRKSTRLNSSHSQISYAVFCLKKKKQPYAKCMLTYAARTIT